MKINAQETAEYSKDAPYYVNPYTDFHDLLIDIKIFSDSLTGSENKSIRKMSKVKRKKEIEKMLLWLNNNH